MPRNKGPVPSSSRELILTSTTLQSTPHWRHQNDRLSFRTLNSNTTTPNDFAKDPTRWQVSATVSGPMTKAEKVHEIRLLMKENWWQLGQNRRLQSQRTHLSFERMQSSSGLLPVLGDARCSVRKDILEAKGKGRKLAGKVKGGGRCGERAVCEERGDRKWRVESTKPGRRGGVVECEFSWFQPLPIPC